MGNLNLGKRTNSFMVAGLFLLSSFFMVGCGQSGHNLEIDGVDGPHLLLVDDTLRVSMTFENLHVEGGLRYVIPKYPNSYVEISPSFDTEGTLMVFKMNISDVLDMDPNMMDPQALPGGRALPGVATGTLPAVAFSLEQFNNVTVYLGPKVLGFFVPSENVGIGQGILTSRFYSSGSRVGNISLVGEDAYGENSGILLLLDMDSNVKRRLKRYIDRL